MAACSHRLHRPQLWGHNNQGGQPRNHATLHVLPSLTLPKALCKPGDATREVADSTCGIIFLGTPHLGSPVSRAGSLAAYLTGFLGSDTSLLLALASHRNQLSDLEDRFIACMNHKRRRRDKTRIASFYETKPTYLGCLSLGVVRAHVSSMTQRLTLDVLDCQPRFCTRTC